MKRRPADEPKRRSTTTPSASGRRSRPRSPDGTGNEPTSDGIGTARHSDVVGETHRALGNQAAGEVFRSENDGHDAPTRDAAVRSGVETAKREERAGEGYEVNESVAAEIESAGGGRPLDPGVRGEMESRFGTDLEGVTVHADSRADRLNERVGATAFAAGTDVFFRRGAYEPETTRGRGLLAHELAHVVSGAARDRTIHRWPWDDTEQSPEEQAREDLDRLLEIVGEGENVANNFEETTETLAAVVDVSRAVDEVGSDAYRQKGEFVEELLEKSGEVADELETLKKIGERATQIKAVVDTAEAVYDVSQIDENDFMNDPQGVARKFDALAEEVGSLFGMLDDKGLGLRLPFLGMYADFIKTLGEQNFFENMYGLMEAGGLGASSLGGRSDMLNATQRDASGETQLQQEWERRWDDDELEQGLATAIQSGVNGAERRIENGELGDAVASLQRTVVIMLQRAGGNPYRRDALALLDSFDDAVDAYEDYDGVWLRKSAKLDHLGDFESNVETIRDALADEFEMEDSNDVVDQLDAILAEVESLRADHEDEWF